MKVEKVSEGESIEHGLYCFECASDSVHADFRIAFEYGISFYLCKTHRNSLIKALQEADSNNKTVLWLLFNLVRVVRKAQMTDRTIKYWTES